MGRRRGAPTPQEPDGRIEFICGGPERAHKLGEQTGGFRSHNGQKEWQCERCSTPTRRYFTRRGDNSPNKVRERISVPRKWCGVCATKEIRRLLGNDDAAIGQVLNRGEDLWGPFEAEPFDVERHRSFAPVETRVFSEAFRGRLREFRAMRRAADAAAVAAAVAGGVPAAAEQGGGASGGGSAAAPAAAAAASDAPESDPWESRTADARLPGASSLEAERKEDPAAAAGEPAAAAAAAATAAGAPATAAAAAAASPPIRIKKRRSAMSVVEVDQSPSPTPKKRKRIVGGSAQVQTFHIRRLIDVQLCLLWRSGTSFALLWAYFGSVLGLTIYLCRCGSTTRAS